MGWCFLLVSVWMWVGEQDWGCPFISTGSTEKGCSMLDQILTCQRARNHNSEWTAALDSVFSLFFFFFNSEFSGNGDWGQKIFINSRWNFVGWRKGRRKFVGKKLNISLQHSQGRSQMPSDFLGYFKIWPFFWKLHAVLIKKKISSCKGKAIKGGVKCPQKETKPATELKWTVTSWAKRTFAVLRFHFLLESQEKKLKQKPKQTTLVFPNYLNFCNHFLVPVFWVQPPFGFPSGDSPLFSLFWGHVGWQRGAKSIVQNHSQPALGWQTSPQGPVLLYSSVLQAAMCT